MTEIHTLFPTLDDRNDDDDFWVGDDNVGHLERLREIQPRRHTDGQILNVCPNCSSPSLHSYGDSSLWCRACHILWQVDLYPVVACIQCDSPSPREDVVAGMTGRCDGIPRADYVCSICRDAGHNILHLDSGGKP